MRRITITTALAVIGLAAGAFAFKSLARVQNEQHAGRSGWVLIQDRLFTDLEGKTEKIGMTYSVYGSDGSWRQRIMAIKDGKKTCSRTIAFVPGRGTFEEDKAHTKLLFINEATTRSAWRDIPANYFSSQPGYSGDEMILGYKCAHFVNRASDGAIEDRWYAYNFGGEQLKAITRKENGTDIFEPKTITLGEPSASLMSYHNEWSIDYTLYEMEVERVRSIDPTHAAKMKTAMERLKAIQEQEPMK